MGDVARPLLVVCGLRAEARIAAGQGVVTICGGGNAAGLQAAILAALERGVAGVLSFGIAGGLMPGLRAGDVVLAQAVRDGAVTCPCDRLWLARLVGGLPAARIGVFAGVDQPATDAGQKTRLAAATGALAVDMESHIAARLAAARGLPFAALRVISDDFSQMLPPAALVGMKLDGRADLAAVLRSLWRQPGQLPQLIRTAQDAGRALARLRKCSVVLGRDFGFAPGTH